MFIVIDCGSTTTRLYFIRNDEVVIKDTIPFGVDSTVATGSNLKLKQGIADEIQRLLSSNGLKLSDIRFAIASGMITSNRSITTLSGQVYGVSLKETFLSASVKTDDSEPPFFCEKVME